MIKEDILYAGTRIVGRYDGVCICNGRINIRQNGNRKLILGTFCMETAYGMVPKKFILAPLPKANDGGVLPE